MCTCVCIRLCVNGGNLHTAANDDDNDNNHQDDEWQPSAKHGVGVHEFAMNKES